MLGEELLHAHLLRGADVLAQGEFSGIGVPAFDGIDHRAMLLERFCGALLTAKRGAAP